MEIAVIILAVAVVAGALILAFARPKPAPAPMPDPRLDTLLAKQGEIGGQFTQTVAAQETLTRTLGERLEALEKRVGENLAATAKQTGETFVSITERLSVIDAAQKNISELSTHVVSLKAIFSDKQARGAISQDQMEAIVAEHLAPDQYEFQATLSNNARPDCVIRIPNVKARIVVDSKFPLEAFEALRKAKDDATELSADHYVGVKAQLVARLYETIKEMRIETVDDWLKALDACDRIEGLIHDERGKAVAGMDTIAIPRGAKPSLINRLEPPVSLPTFKKKATS